MATDNGEVNMAAENAAGEVKPVAKTPVTVGRMVYFKTRGSADGVYPPTNFAAIVTVVHSDTCVSLATFGEAGLRFEQKVEQGENGGQWDWMPFQKDQQARLAKGTENDSHPAA